MEDFPGRQEDERILFVAKPHVLMLVLSIVKALLTAFLLLYVFVANQEYLIGEWPQGARYIPRVIVVITGIWILWRYKYWLSSGAYFTDRRLVRFEAVFPVTEKRRVIFWKEVTKARGIAPNFVWRLLNIGAIEVSPGTADSGSPSTLTVRHLPYFEDLAAYVDKLVYLNNFSPEKLAEVKAFVMAPRGKRY